MDNKPPNFRKDLKESRLETELKDFKVPLTPPEAVIEANRCLYCFDAPCMRACPTSINIPQFISRIATGNTIGAAKTILDANILGLSCSQSCPVEVLCEGSCVYNHLDKKPLAIGKLQRFAVTEAYTAKKQFYTAGQASGKRVALIGAGPASLACAHELRKQGHTAIIFEKSHLPGGLNTFGIAPYKLKSEISLLEIEQIAALGVEFRFGQELGKDLQLKDLVKEFDAVFLGLGLGQDSFIDIPGIHLPEVIGAVDFISKIKSGATDMSWVKRLHSALIIGGGNTALDASRELKKLGVPRVIMSYRRDKKDMSGYEHECKLALQEGVEFWFNTMPIKMEPTSAKSVKVKIQKTFQNAMGELIFIDEYMDIEVGVVFLATGQAKLENLLSSISELKFERGRLVTDSEGRTGNPKIYAGGDISNGGKEVVNAVSEGKKAAIAMNSVFKGFNGINGVNEFKGGSHG